MCDKKMARQNRSKHIFSHAHTKDIDDAILRSRRGIQSWIADYDAGKKKLDDRLPGISLKERCSTYHIICTACRFMGKSTDRPHKCTALGRKVTINYYRSVLGNEDKVARFEQVKAMAKPCMAVQTDAGDGTASKTEVELLQKQVEKLKKQNKELKEDSDLVCDLDDALYVTLKTLAEEEKKGEVPRRVLVDILGYIKKNSADVYDKMKGNLGELWYDSNMHKVDDEIEAEEV